MKKTPLIALFLTIFIDLLGFGIVIPFLPYYATQYGAKGWVAGAVVGVYSLMQFFFSPVWGRMSDRIGRRPVLMISLVGSTSGYLIFAFAHSLPMLFAARIIAGIAAANIGTAQAYIADVTTPENRAKGMGLIGAAFGSGFILGPPIGGLMATLSEHHHHPGNFYTGLLASGLSLIALLICTFGLPESLDLSRARTIRSARPPQFDPQMWQLVGERKALAKIFGMLFIIILAFAGMETTVTLVARNHFNLNQMGLAYIFLFMGLIVVGLQGGGIGPLTKRFGERKVVLIGALALGLGLSLVPLITVADFLFGAAFFVAIGQGLCYPALTSLVTRWSPAEERGSMLGIGSSIASLSRIIGPVLGGSLYDTGGTRGAFWTLAAVVFCGFFLMLGVPPLSESAALEQMNLKG